MSKRPFSPSDPFPFPASKIKELAREFSTSADPLEKEMGEVIADLLRYAAKGWMSVVLYDLSEEMKAKLTAAGYELKESHSTSTVVSWENA